METRRLVEDEQEPVGANQLGSSVAIYFSILVIGWIYFDCARRSNRAAYACRDRSAEFRTPLVERKYGFMGWLKAVLSVSDEEMMEYCGLDTVIYLRFQRLCIKIALVGMACAIILFPVYGTGDPEDGEIDELDKISMTNLKDNDPRLYVSIFATWFLSCGTMYLVYHEYQNYVRLRHEFLQRPEVQQYSILIDNLPMHLRSNATLKRYMAYLFPGQVRSVYVAVELGNLEKEVAERENVRARLEHALTRQSKDQTRLTHKVDQKFLCCGGREVDSINTYQERLNELNDIVFDTIRDLQKRQVANETRLQSPQGHEVSTKPRAVSKQEQESIKRDGAYVQVIDDSEALEIAADTKLMRGSGFVSFTSIQAAQVAQQLLQTCDPFKMNITAAPAVEDVYWPNVGISHKTKSSWQFASTVISTAIVFFWTIPTAFVGALSSVESLKREIPALESAIDDHKWIETILTQLAPLMLVIMNALAPIIFRILSQREGHCAESHVEASLFSKLSWFQLIQTFFVASVSSILFESINDIIDRPSSAASILGANIPKKASFFMSYLVIQTGLSLTLELLRVVPRIVAFIHSKIAPKLTERERGQPFLGLKPLSFPEQFEQTNLLADNYLVLILILVYAPIAPLIAFFAGFYFLVAELVYRRQTLFIHDPSPNSTGVYWPRLYEFVIVALMVGQITMIGYLGVKKSPAVALVIALPVLTLIFNSNMKASFPRTAMYLPMDECSRVDRQRAGRDESGWEFLDGAYTQPAMDDKDPLYPEYTQWEANSIQQAVASV